MKGKSFDTELNKKRAARLKECRKKKGITQEQLADLLGYQNGQTIYNWESCKRPMPTDIDTIKRMAKSLDVNYRYLLCESDIPAPHLYKAYQDNFSVDDMTIDMDRYFILFLENLSHEIDFDVLPLFSDNLPLIERIDASKDIPDAHIDISDLTERANVEQLDDFNLSLCRCYKDNKEVAIINAIVDGHKMPIGHFKFFINRIYDYINFMLSPRNMVNMIDDIEHIDWIDDDIKSQYKESLYHIDKDGLWCGNTLITKDIQLSNIKEDHGDK